MADHRRSSCDAVFSVPSPSSSLSDPKRPVRTTALERPDQGTDCGANTQAGSGLELKTLPRVFGIELRFVDHNALMTTFGDSIDAVVRFNKENEPLPFNRYEF